MSEKTGIEWASHTASPWFGCSKVSAGCTNCYAEELTLRNKWAGWGDKSPRVRSKGFWKDAYRFNTRAGVSQTEAEGVGLNPNNYRPRMFTSLMDWLDPMVPAEWLHAFLQVIKDCQNLDWLLLTKRPELFRSRMEDAMRWNEDNGNCGSEEMHRWLLDWVCGDKVPQNVWFGTTVENQELLEKRAPILFSIPARVRWVSAEPLLGPLHLHENHGGMVYRYLTCAASRGIDWVVVGGESGRNRRELPVEAIVHVANQCQLMGVPCFVKQDTALKPGQQGRIPDDTWSLKQYPRL